MKKQSLGILLSLMGAACLYTGCNNDVTPGQEGAECSPACGEMQECVNGECKDLETPPLPPSCDPACGENQECVDGECKDKQTGPETKTCANANETNCDGGCFDLTSDKDNCGECGKICPAGEICENSQCKAEEVEAECQDTDAPTCEGNAVKKCENGHFVTTDCEALTCEEGECKTLAECSDDMEPFCDGNAVKSCKSGHYDLQDCQNKACVAGACSDENFEKECDNDGVSVCDNNQVKTCKAGKFEYQNCTAAGLTCETTEEGVQCAAVEKPECTESDAPTCEGNSLKSCVDGKFAFEACPGICENGACKAVAIEDLCPDDASKTAPGVCGCGIPDIDSDNNGTMDCQELDSNGKPLDLCPDDPNKLLPGICGCGIPDDINENSGNPYCLEFGDLCPEDTGKTMPGVCGCGYSDKINEFTNIPECIGVDIVGNNLDLCPDDSNKLLAGTCGCGIADTLDSENHIPSCVLSEEDLCVNDADKTKPGICGCGVVDDVTDSDNDGVPDCIDQCPNNPVKYIEDDCGCDEIKVNLDGGNFCAIPIKTAEEFNDLKTGTLSPSKNYALINDINLYDYYGTTSINDWVGVKNFSGKFVSSGKTISFKKDSDLGTLKCTADYCGLFSTIEGARIHNVKLEMNVQGANYVGILAGRVLNSSHIDYLDVVGNVITGASQVGGVIGSTYGVTLNNISYKGNVNATGANRIGGLIGWTEHSSTHLLSNIAVEANVKAPSGNYVGGIIGAGDGTPNIATASFKGNVECGATYGGGIAGVYYGSYIKDVTIEGTVKGHTYLGGVGGRVNSQLTNITNKAEIISELKSCGWNGIIGGLVGLNDNGSVRTYENLFNYGNITVTEPESCIKSGDGNFATSVGGIIGYWQNYGSSLINAHNYGNITSPSNWGLGGVVGNLYGGVNIKNASNSGTITNTNVHTGKTGGVFGNWRHLTSRAAATLTIENVKNTGKVTGGSMVGGIAHGISMEQVSSKLLMKNIVNEGDVISSTCKFPKAYGVEVGGIVGRFDCQGICELENIYSTGNVSVSSDVEVSNAYVGGIAGYLKKDPVTWDWSTVTINGIASKLTTSTSFNRVYSTGNISVTGANLGKTGIGGVIGYMDMNAVNRRQKEAAKNITCGSTTVSQSALYTWADADNTIKITNTYSIGKINGPANTAGLIGHLVGTSQNATYTNRIYNASTCEPTDETFTVQSSKKLIVANVFTSNETSATAPVGGLIGNFNYANSLGDSYNNSFNNVYSTSVVPESGGALFGSAVSNTSFKNLYYWPKSGAANVTPSGTVTGAVSFDFAAGVPHIDQDNVDLLNQLNGNVKSSSTDELNTKVSATWAAKEHVITGKVKANIPFLEIAPEEMPWEAEQQQEESGRD